MPNQYKNKVIYGDQTLMDITDTTASSEDVLEGEVFYSANGARSVGALGDATTSTHGLMSMEDKVKLDNINEIQIDKTLDTSADIMSFHDGADDMPVKELTVGIEPVQDLHGYDNPWPGGGGVNKIDVNQLTSYGTTYGLTTSFDGDWIVLSGEYTISNQAASFRIATLNSRSVFPVTKFKAFPDSNTSSHMTPNTFGLADGNKTLTINLTNMVQGETYNLRIKIVGYEGDTAPTAWTPYSNICPISGWTGAKVTRTGRNLFDINRVQGTPIPSTLLESPRVMETNKWYKGLRADNYYYTGYANCTIENNVLTVHTFTNVNYGIGFPISCKPNTTYIISAEQTGCNFSVGCYDKDWNFLSRLIGVTTYVSPLSFTTPNNAEYITVVIGSAVNGEGIASNLQLELGSTATSYEPYQGETYDIEFPSEAGTVYGGTLDVVSGELIVDRAYALLNDATKWINITGTLTYRYEQDFSDRKIFNNSYNGLICSIVPVINNARFTGRWNGATTYRFGIYDPDGTWNLEGIKASATNGEITICYYLATPITYNLTPQEIRTLLGQNNIWADTGNINSVTYSKLTSGLINTYDKVKLDQIEGLPPVTSSDNNKILQVTNGAWDAATLTNANSSAAGLMSAADKIKLDGIELLGVKLNTTTLTPDANGYVSIPLMTGATSSADGAAGLIPAPTSTDREKFFRGDGTWQDCGRPMVILSYGSSTWNDFIEAYNHNAIVYCRASSNGNPAIGAQGRMAPMAYINNGDAPTEVEFQYYRSVSSHTATQMGDQVYIYKLNKNSGWSVTLREGGLKQIVEGTGISVSYSNNKITINTDIAIATTSADGLMSATDKTKLDGIATGATATTVENALTSTSTTNALSAAQGKALNDSISSLNTKIGTVGNTDLQTQVTALSNNKIDKPTSVAAGKFLQTDANGNTIWGDGGSTISITTEEDKLIITTH